RMAAMKTATTFREPIPLILPVMDQPLPVTAVLSILMLVPPAAGIQNFGRFGQRPFGTRFGPAP
ncbi:MAG TPA: hypothetical protein VLH13_01360, partial [Methanomassiliicoccales archaeon]|nr:hypothetical protein [Methanomassiliicoccales archaeon]